VTIQTNSERIDALEEKAAQLGREIAELRTLLETYLTEVRGQS
jgi:hypothetical protein